MRMWGLVAVMVALAAGAFAADDRDVQVQFQRYDQMIGRLQEQNDALRQTVRGLERSNAELSAAVKASVGKSEVVSDQMQKLQNTQLINLQAGQQQLLDKLKDQKHALDWGAGQRDCPDVGVKHQQIKVMTKPDATRTVKFLCFDGKLLHLGTELHDPADAR